MSVHPATLCLVAQKEGNDQSVENVSIVQKFPEGNEIFSPPSPPGGTWCPSRDHHCPQLIGLDQKSVERSTKKEMFSDCVANGGAGDGSHGNLNAAGRRNFYEFYSLPREKKPAKNPGRRENIVEMQLFPGIFFSFFSRGNVISVRDGPLVGHGRTSAPPATFNCFPFSKVGALFDYRDQQH